MKIPTQLTTALVAATCLLHSSAWAGFEGRIQATFARGGETQSLLYTVGTNQLRIERTETNWPHAKNIIARDSGAVLLVFPHNRSFVCLKPASDSAATPFPAPPGMPMPPGIGPQSTPVNSPAPEMIGPTNLPGSPPVPQRPVMQTLPAMPSPPAGMPPGVGPQTGPASEIPSLPAGMPNMPMMPPMMDLEKIELHATTDTTQLLGYTCARYELKQRGEVMEIWATDELLPFQAWRQNQPPRFGPRMIEEQWAELLRTKKLFPLRAVLKFENGTERLRFEVTAVTAEKIKDEDGKLFQPPPDYQELEPLPF